MAPQSRGQNTDARWLPCPKGVSGHWHMAGAWCQETDVVLKATCRIPTPYLDTSARLCQLLGKVRRLGWTISTSRSWQNLEMLLPCS